MVAFRDARVNRKDLFRNLRGDFFALGKVRIELTPAARERVVVDGYDPAYGARPLRRTVQRLVQDPLAMRILDGSVLPGDLVRVDVDPESDSMRFERVEEKTAPAAQAEVAGTAASTAKSSRTR